MRCGVRFKCDAEGGVDVLVCVDGCSITMDATLLNSSITIYHYCPNTPFTSTTFQPYPLKRSNLITTTTIPPISLWCQNSLFLLLTKQHIPLPHPLTALPPLPISNHTNTGELTHIPVPPTYISLPNCPYQDPIPPSTLPSSFCPTHCHSHCPNHFNAFRPIPLKIYSPTKSPQQLLTAIGIPPNTPLIEIASKISTTSSQTTFPITNYAHTHALTTHPLIPLLLTTTPPNCCLQPLLIPDPHPHLRLFLTSLTTIPPYTALSIRPPPQPPPPPEPPPSRDLLTRSSSSQRTPSRITDFFKSIRR